MSLLTLPAELVHHVLDYCDVQTTLFSVRCVCKRLNGIVNTYNRLDLVFNSKSSYSMEAISRILQPENVLSLVLCNDYGARMDQITLFLSLFTIDQFTSLQSVTLYRIKNIDLQSILEHVHINHSFSLSINSYEREHEKTWTVVSSALNRCNLQQLYMNNINYHMNYITWPDQYKLNHLEIQDCTYNDYLIILRQLSNLRTLVMRHCSFRHFDDKLLLSSTPLFQHFLTSLIVTDYSISLENLAHLVSPVPSLRHLKLISYKKIFDYVFNGSHWHEFILAKLPVLDRFEFFFAYTYSPNQNFASLESIMVPFRTPFYLDDKRWFVVCTYIPRIHAIWLYTTPICSTDYMSSLRCEVSWTDDICRITEWPINETNHTTAHETPFSALDFGGNGIGAQEVRHLADALQYNMVIQTITSLDLHDNAIGDVGVEHLTAALRDNTTLTTLNLSRNIIGDQGAQYLAHFLRYNETLTSINLIRNRIANQGAQYLAHVLQHNKTLTTLHLWNNEIGEQGVQSLSAALRRNTTLKILDLTGNKIQTRGMKYLANALRHNTTLKQLWLWNNDISPDLQQQLQEHDRRIQC